MSVNETQKRQDDNYELYKGEMNTAKVYECVSQTRWLRPVGFNKCRWAVDFSWHLTLLTRIYRIFPLFPKDLTVVCNKSYDENNNPVRE